MDFLDNVTTRAVKTVQERLDGLSAEEVEKCERAATLEMEEWFHLGDLWTRSVLEGFIDTDSAQALHVIHTRFHGKATLAERLVMIKIGGELLALHIERAQKEVARRG